MFPERFIFLQHNDLSDHCGLSGATVLVKGAGFGGGGGLKKPLSWL
jgi:hypothetical protein